MNYTVWHNPRCRNSRGTIDLMKENGIEPKVRLYLEDSPNKEELENVKKLLGKKPIEFTRIKQSEFKEAGLKKESSDEEILNAMVKFPILIERPIVIKNNEAAVVSRPPETILEFIK